jgi:hypothetical protein
MRGYILAIYGFDLSCLVDISVGWGCVVVVGRDMQDAAPKRCFKWMPQQLQRSVLKGS